MKIAVVVNLSKEKAISCAKEIAILFLGENAEVVMLSECKPFYKGINISYVDTIDELFGCCDAAVTAGGDGTIINAAKYAAVNNVPLIGVNVGRLGFAADLEPDDIGRLKKLVNKEYTTFTGVSRKLMDSRSQCKIEIWRYNPDVLTLNNCVDELSLYLSLMSDEDERVEEALEILLDNVWERLDGNRN